MGLLARNNAHGMVMGECGSPLEPVFLAERDPASANYRMPAWYSVEKEVTSWALATWLEEVQVGRAPLFSLSVNCKHAARLLKKYKPRDIIRATHYSALVTNNPFSFKFVGEVLEDERKRRM